MHWLLHLFGIHLTIVQFALLVLLGVVLLHFLLFSKDFRMFVIIGMFGFASSLGKMLGIVLLTATLAFVRGVKIFFEFQIFAIAEIFRAIQEEDDGIHDAEETSSSKT